jgi:hypothetical protein
MKKFLTKFFYLLLPLIVWGILIAIIDPFNYFGFEVFQRSAKKEAESLNTLIYRTIDYVNEPCENVIFGDSRTYNIPLERIEEISKRKYKKLNTNGAKLNEIFDLFYFANSKTPIKRVVIGINFNMFNKFGHEDRVEGVKRMLNNPFMYVYNKDVAEAAYSTIKYTFTDKKPDFAPPMSRKEFWDWSINTKASHWYGKYAFPEKLYSQLLNFDKFTKANKIDVIFIIVPHHSDFHKRLVDFGLQKEEAKFKQIMSGLSAKVYDFDYVNAITSNTVNFEDPIHYTNAVGNTIVNEIWTNKLIIGKEI